MLKPIDHQNIVIRIIGMSACTPRHITTVAQSYGLDISLYTITSTCHFLCAERVLALQPNGVYALTGLGEICLPNTPMMDSYYALSANTPLRTAYTPAKCPECQQRKPAADFRDAGTGETLPACKRCLRIRQRGGRVAS